MNTKIENIVKEITTKNPYISNYDIIKEIKKMGSEKVNLSQHNDYYISYKDPETWKEEWEISKVLNMIKKALDSWNDWKLSIEKLNVWNYREKSKTSVLISEKDKVEFFAWSLRYAVFQKSQECICCWLKAKYFKLQITEKDLNTKGYWIWRINKDNKMFHFNLYWIDETWKEIMFTKDHILPRSKWWKDSLDNMQTMCSVCNLIKWNLLF